MPRSKDGNILILEMPEYAIKNSSFEKIRIILQQKVKKKKNGKKKTWGYKAINSHFIH